MIWLLIGIGGSLGSISRYRIAEFFKNKNISFPISTIIVNSLGSFLLGYFLGYNIINETQGLHYFITGGFLGAFTTFSAFSLEMFDLLITKQTTKAFIYIILHILVILFTGLIGFILSY